MKNGTHLTCKSVGPGVGWRTSLLLSSKEVACTQNKDKKEVDVPTLTARKRSRRPGENKETQG